MTKNSNSNAKASHVHMTPHKRMIAVLSEIRGLAIERALQFDLDLREIRDRTITMFQEINQVEDEDSE